MPALSLARTLAKWDDRPPGDFGADRIGGDRADVAACSETLGGFNTHVARSSRAWGSSLQRRQYRFPHRRHSAKSGDAAAYNTRGVVYAKLGKYSNAIEDFSHTIKLDPHFSGAYTNRALAYRRTKKDDLATQDFNQAISVNRKRRGSVSRPRQPRARARRLFGALNDLNRRSGKPQGAKPISARPHLSAPAKRQAITDFNNAIDRDPFAGEPYQARGQS